jgi:predicted ester cyclase
VTVNGTSMPVAGIVARARAMQATYADRRMDVLDLVETPERVVVAFRMSGRHIGPLETPLGTVPPTGRFVEMRTIDVLVLSGGRVSSIWVVADELGMLTQLGAVRVDPTYQD